MMIFEIAAGAVKIIIEILIILIILIIFFILIAPAIIPEPGVQELSIAALDKKMLWVFFIPALLFAIYSRIKKGRKNEKGNSNNFRG